MPDPPLKKFKTSLVKLSSKAKHSVLELEYTNSESSDFANLTQADDSDSEITIEICNRPEAELEADAMDLEDKEEDSDILLPTPATISKKRKQHSKTKAVCECYRILQC